MFSGVTRLIGALAISMLAAFSASAAPARIALVIGNHRYEQQAAQIRAAENDAIAVAEKLRDVGFDVDLVIDATKQGFKDALLRYDAKLEANDGAETVFYYSGHGASHEGQSYLVPIDLGQVDPAGFLENAVGIGRIYQIFRKRAPQLGLVLLDACRTSPFTNDKIKPGLSRQPPDMPARVITAFADDEDEAVGTQNDGIHSAFTKAILLHLGTPGLSLGDFFIAVRNSTLGFTDRHQDPYVSTKQRVPFFFRDAAFVEIDSDDVDDDMVVSVAGDTFVRDVDGPRKRLRLVPGDNVLTVTAVNFPTMDSKLKREGWKYRAQVSPSKGDRFELGAFEEFADRSRYGRSFVSERVVLHVDPGSAKVAVKAHEPAIWEDGFSLIGSAPGDELYHAIRWAVTARGVRLFDDSSPGSVDRDRLRNEVREQHLRATNHSHGSAEIDDQWHKPHVTAAALVAESVDRDVDLVVDRLRREAAPQAHTSLLWLCEDAPKRALIRRYFDAGEFGRVRVFYRKTQLHAAEVKPHLNSLSNEDLSVAVEDVCRANTI